MNFPKAPSPIPGFIAVKGLFLIVVLTLLSSVSPLRAAAPPTGWQVAGFGRGGVLVNDAIVDYDAGTWNVKTGPSRYAIVSQSLRDDVSVTVKVTDASGAVNAHIGLMMWSSLAMTAGKAGLTMDPQGQKIYFSWDEATDGRASFFANYLQAEGMGFPVWLKLSRSGSYVAGYYSKDGKDWRQVGVPIKTFWAGKRPEIFAGMYGDGVCEQRVTDVKISNNAPTMPSQLPSGSELSFQGAPEYVGDASFADGKWTLAGASTHGRGGFHNVTVQQTADAKVQLTAKLRLADLADPRSAGGLLLSAHGVDAVVMAYPATARLSLFTRQTTTGRVLQYKNLPMPSTLTGQAEMYLRLALVDARVAAFYGSGPNDWTQLGDVLTVNELSADITGGMEMFCDSGSRLVTSVRFENFQAEAITVLPIKAPPAPVVAAAPAPRPTTAAVTPQPIAQRPVQQSYPVSYPTTKPPINWSGLISNFVCVGIVLLVIVTIVFIKPFNRLVYLRNRALKGWSQIDVQLKRRHDLILNFMEAVKGYAKHERGTLEGVAQARSAAANATTVQESAKAEAALNVTMRSLYVVVEAYPDLKADKQFMALQGNLRETEDKLAGARNEYNEEVLNYNTQVQSFPTNIIALVFRFKQREFFEVKGEEEREAPKAAM